jgi:transposase
MSKKKSQITIWKEKRRFHAVSLERKGWKQKDIAIALDVSKGAVSQWLKAFKEEGKEILQAHPHTGRAPGLADKEMRSIPDFLSEGAESYGFQGDGWTCSRVRKVIEIEFGIFYHKSHVARLLKELKWTPQQPIERATQRDEDAIAYWRKHVWSDMKKKPIWSVESLFSWMNLAFTSCLPPSKHIRLAGKRPFCVSSKLTTTYLS